MELQSTRRPLTAAERRLLETRVKIFDLDARSIRRRAMIGGFTVVLTLWLLTVLFSDAPWHVVTVFWIVVGGGITAWVVRDLGRGVGDHAQMARALESGSKRNEADVFRVSAVGFAEFEEVEDEGACYAFQLAGERLVFVSGQQFYGGAKFPSLDFALVYVLNEHDKAVDMFIQKFGARATPDRVIPAAVKLRLDIPDHLEVRSGSISQLEHTLKRRS